MKTKELIRFESIAWRREGNEHFSDFTDAITEERCVLTINPEKYSSKIKGVDLYFTVEPEERELINEMQDAATSNETFDLALSIPKVDEELDPLRGRIPGDKFPRTFLGNRKTEIVVKEGKKQLASYIYYDEDGSPHFTP